MRSFFFFLFWFLWVGGSNVVPQVYFLTHAPAYKEVAISLLLMMGSLASVAGILLGGRLPAFLNRNGLKPRVFVPMMLAVCLSCFAALFLDLSPAIYFFCYLLFRFVSCLLYQFLDLVVIHGSDPDTASRHNRDAMLFMFLAITVSPLFFAYVDSTFYVALIIMILGLASLYFLRNSKPGLVASKSAMANFVSMSRIGSVWPFILYTGAYLSVIYLTSSLLVYFIRDYYGLLDPVRKAGWVMLSTSGSAVVSAIAYSKFRRDVIRDMNTLWVQALIIGLQIVAILALFLKLSDSLLYLCLCISLMGIAYGMFMVLTRQYAAALEAQERSGMLALYNLLPYGSTIVVFSVAGGLKIMATHLGADFYMLVAGLLTLLLSLVVMVLPWHATVSRNHSNCVAIVATEKKSAD